MPAKGRVELSQDTWRNPLWMHDPLLSGYMAVPGPGGRPIAVDDSRAVATMKEKTVVYVDGDRAVRHHGCVLECPPRSTDAGSFPKGGQHRRRSAPLRFVGGDYGVRVEGPHGGVDLEAYRTCAFLISQDTTGNTQKVAVGAIKVVLIAATGARLPERGNTWVQGEAKLEELLRMLGAQTVKGGTNRGTSARPIRRSEEHTSELQSLRHLVCRLL